MDAGDTLSFAWDLDNDGAFDDAFSEQPVVTSGHIETLGLGLGEHSVTVQVTDVTGRVATAGTTFAILVN